MHIEVPAVPVEDLQKRSTGEPSDLVRVRVESARERMLARQGRPNALLEPRELDRHVDIDDAAVAMLTRAIAKLGLSARSYHRTIKVARSIADLCGRDVISRACVAEALGYRQGC